MKARAANDKTEGQQGFTLIETLLVIAMIVIVASLSLPVARSLQTTNEVDVAAIALAQGLRQARQLAEAGALDDNWGIEVISGGIILYRGSSYAARVVSYDQTTDIAANITPSGLSEVNFTKITGTPSTTGTFTLTGLYGKVETIIINSKAMVSY